MRIGAMSNMAAATLDDLVQEAKTAEEQGFATLTVPNIFGLDAIGALTVVGRETERVELLTGVAREIR